MKKYLLRFGVSLLLIPIIYLSIALLLVAFRFPSESAFETRESLNFDSLLALDYSAIPELQSYTARDGSELQYRHYESSSETNTVVILIHGSGWHSMQFLPMASHLSDQGVAHVITPDLRGHGFSPKRRGDIDYIGQLEDDVADLISVLRNDYPNAQMVLGGHSSGGGLAVRFAGSDYNNLSDAYILFAPFLKYNAPTTKPDSGDWAQPLTARIIGLSLLNPFGVTALNHLEVIRFSMPDDVLKANYGHTATTSYSYRLNTAYAPRDDFGTDLSQITQPFLVIAGTEDEAFYAERYEETIAAYTSTGTYILVEGVNHMGAMTDFGVQKEVKDWLLGF